MPPSNDPTRPVPPSQQKTEPHVPLAAASPTAKRAPLSAVKRKHSLWPWILGGVGCFVSMGGGCLFVGLVGLALSGRSIPGDKTAEAPGGSREGSREENGMPLHTYLATRPQEPVKFRLRATLSDYYNYSYRHCANSHYSIRLNDLDIFGPRAHGYIRKDSPDGERLFALLRDGKQHRVTVELQSVGPAGGFLTPEHGDVLAITRVLDP